MNEIEKMIKKKSEMKFKGSLEMLEQLFKDTKSDNITDIIILKDVLIANITSWRMVGVSEKSLSPLVDMYFSSVKAFVKLIKGEKDE